MAMVNNNFHYYYIGVFVYFVYEFILMFFGFQRLRGMVFTDS